MSKKLWTQAGSAVCPECADKYGKELPHRIIDVHYSKCTLCGRKSVVIPPKVYKNK